jgi:hypothetical protein
MISLLVRRRLLALQTARITTANPAALNPNLLAIEIPSSLAFADSFGVELVKGEISKGSEGNGVLVVGERL